MNKWIKYLLAALIVILLISLGLVPNILTGYLNKNSKELSGRIFSIGDIDVNYFTGKVSIEDFYMLEMNQKDTFISFQELILNLAMARSAFGEVTIEEVDLFSPKGKVIQDSSGFNFDDLIEYHTSEDNTSDKSDTEDEFHYLIKNINLHGGELSYTLTEINSTIGFKNIRAECPQISSKDPVIKASVSLDFLHGGNASADGLVNILSYDYLIHSKVDSLHLSFMEPVLMEYMNISQLNGYASSSMNITGNYDNTEILNASGNLKVESFRLSGPDSSEVVYFNLFELNMDTVELQNAHFDIEYIKMDSVFTLFELYENDNNFERLLATAVSTEGDSVNAVTAQKNEESDDQDDEESIYLSIANSINSYFREYSIAQYNIDALEVTRSAFIFRDFSMADDFEYRVTSMNASGKGLDSKKERIRIEADCILNESGVFDGEFELDPLNFLNLELHYTVSDFNVYDFSPHSSHYVAYPIMDGKLVYKCDLTIQDGILENYNYIQVNDFDFGDKDKKDPIYELPVKLAVGLLKDNKGVINLEVPVTGDLNDPKFHIWKTILNILKNIIIKAATAPYKLVAGLFEGDEDAAQNIYLIPGRSDLKEGHEKSSKGVFVTTKEKPGIDIEFVMMTDSLMDVGALAVIIMKETYHSAKLKDTISTDINNVIRNDDPDFITFIDSLANLKGTDATDLESKCIDVTDRTMLNERYHYINTERVQHLEKSLSDQLVPESRYRIRIAAPGEMISQPGIPKFQIQYKQSESISSTE